MTTNTRPTHGDLVRTYPSDKTKVLIHHQPWAALQRVKKTYLLQGVPSKQLKLRYEFHQK